jgi:hypothetical protein
MRIFITLVFGFIFAAIGSVLAKKEDGNTISQIFHLIGGILIPGGFLVLIDELALDNGTLWPFVFVFFIVFGGYLLMNLFQKKPILTFFSIANGTIFVYLFVLALIENVQGGLEEDIMAYLTMAIGISYLILAHSFVDTWNDKISGFVRFFGSLAFFGATFTRVFDSGICQFLYFPIVFGGIYLSTKLKSRSILFVSTIFLISHISYITAEYFADSVGWPIALIFLGFIFIGLGYWSVNISKKYTN